MNATEIIDTLFEKTALNKARALYEAEKLRTPDLKRLFPRDIESEPVNLIHARINAKEKRLAGGVAPKKQMDLSRYLRYERPDTMPKAKQTLDSGRFTRRAGRNNGTVLSAANREGWIAESAKKENNKLRLWGNDSDDPGIKYHLNFDDNTGHIESGAKKPISIQNIDIGPAGLFSDKGGIFENQFSEDQRERLTPKMLKEMRAMIARHELSGELHDIIRVYKGIGNHKIPIADIGNSRINAEAIGIGTHQTVNVLQGDHNFVRKLSPVTQISEEHLRVNSPTNIQSHQSGKVFSERGARNILGDRPLSNSYNKPFTRREKDIAIQNTEQAKQGDGRISNAFLSTKPILNTEF